jgi:hypothetical protein
VTTPSGSSNFTASGGSAGQSYRQPSPSHSTGAGGSNVFTRKLGPLPMWAWMGVGLAVALAFYFWKQHTSSTSSGSITAPGSNPDQSVAASQIPQFVNITQGYSPPSTPSTTTPAPTTTTGPKPIQGVPDLVGMTRATAESTLKNAGLEFQYDLSNLPHHKAAKNVGYTITAQNPPSGAQVQPGQKIQLTIERTSAYDKSHKAGNIY